MISTFRFVAGIFILVQNGHSFSRNRSPSASLFSQKGRCKCSNIVQSSTETGTTCHCFLVGKAVLNVVISFRYLSLSPSFFGLTRRWIFRSAFQLWPRRRMLPASLFRFDFTDPEITNNKGFRIKLKRGMNQKLFYYIFDKIKRVTCR